MESKDPAEAPGPGTSAEIQEPDDPEDTEETLKDEFGNEAERLWWVPMEFTHEFEDGLKQRFTFKLKVAGRDEEDARGNAESVTIDDIVYDNPDFDGLYSDDISEKLDDSDSVCGIDWEDLPCDAPDCPLRVDDEEFAEECFD